APDDDEVAGAVRGDARAPLMAGGVGVDAELRAEGGAGAGEALAEDAPEPPVLLGTDPDDDEVAGAVRTHGRTILSVRRVGVDAELRAQGGAGAGIALTEDTFFRA